MSKLLLNGLNLYNFKHSGKKTLSIYLTRTAFFPAFCGVNAGFPCPECANGLEASLLRSESLDEPDARNRSKNEDKITWNIQIGIVITITEGL